MDSLGLNSGRHLLRDELDKVTAVATAMRTVHPHVVRDPSIHRGEPVVSGTSLKVAFIARFVRQGIGPDEIVQTYPNLTKAAAYDAVSFYFDRQSEIDQLIAKTTPEALQQQYGYERGQKGLIRFKSG